MDIIDKTHMQKTICAMFQHLLNTRKPCYRKDDHAMLPIYGRPEKFWESLATPTATFP